MNGIPIGKWEVNGILKLRNDQKHGKYLKPMGDPLGPNKSNGFAWKLKLQFTARKQVLQACKSTDNKKSITETMTQCRVRVGRLILKILLSPCKERR